MNFIQRRAVYSSGFRLMAAIRVMAALVFCAAADWAGAQSLMVLPVNIHMAPGQGATTLTVANHGDSETAIQIRAYSWSQPDGEDKLAPSDAVLVSPPLASIAPGGTQVVRLVLRKPPEGKEATYRIVLDQIPPPAVPGLVRVVLRLSLPIFAQPPIRTLPHVRFHIERDGEQAFLVAINDGGHHETIRDIVLSTNDGRKLETGPGASPYVLAGALHRWPISSHDFAGVSDQTLRLTARDDKGAVEEQVHVAAVR